MIHNNDRDTYFLIDFSSRFGEHKTSNQRHSNGINLPLNVSVIIYPGSVHDPAGSILFLHISE